MTIKELFTRDINRSINGVVKAEQLDDAVVWQELDEFVVTRELDQHIRKFFGAYTDALDNPQDPTLSGKMGVWISGFFGSGKSHFFKVLSYVLGNRKLTARWQVPADRGVFRDESSRRHALRRHQTRRRRRMRT